MSIKRQVLFHRYGWEESCPDKVKIFHHLRGTIPPIYLSPEQFFELVSDEDFAHAPTLTVEGKLILYGVEIICQTRPAESASSTPCKQGDRSSMATRP